MMIIDVDYHPSFQQIAFLIEETGECGEQRLNHEDGEAGRADTVMVPTLLQQPHALSEEIQFTNDDAGVKVKSAPRGDQAMAVHLSPGESQSARNNRQDAD